MQRWPRRVLLLAFALSIAITVIFAMRAVQHRPHPRVDDPIRPWMSVPYIAHSYHVPPHVLFNAIGRPMERPLDRRPIARIAAEQNRPVEELISDLQDAIVRERQFPPPSLSPGSETKSTEP
jgi:hypothetical protein